MGILGILNLLGFEQLLVLTKKGEVCKIDHKNQEKIFDPTSIFELQEIEIIPFA